MLAQNFKTPADLEISDAQFEALLIVLRMLERGEIQHETWQRQHFAEIRQHRAPQPATFNMASWRCGTAACLGGWAECVADVSFSRYHDNDDGLHRLFFPDSHPDEIPKQTNGHALEVMLAITPAQAAIALRNYLTFGEPRWPEALAE